MPRKRSKGGPFLLYTCPRCQRNSRLERNRAGAFMAGPTPIVPVADALMARFDADLQADLDRKRAWWKKRDGRRDWFFAQHEQELLRAGYRPNNIAERLGVKQAAKPPPRRKAGEREKPRPRPRAAPPPPPPEPEPPPPPPKPKREEPPATPHELLGVEPDADRETITKAFRELAKRYHPDRFDALDEEFKELAHRKFLELKLAYDKLTDGG